MTKRYSTFNMLLCPSRPPPSPPSSSSSRHHPSDDDDISYDLLPPSLSSPTTTPENLAEKFFGKQHLTTILTHPLLLSNFADFLLSRAGEGIKTLITYLDAKKALKALEYSNAILEGEFLVRNEGLEKRLDDAFEGLLEELTGYVTNAVVDVVSRNVTRRITAVEGDAGEEVVPATDDGLGECFCLTDPRREGNPIIFMSEEFNRVTQYGVSYAIGRNCRFLQGPRTDRKTVARLKAAIEAQQETSEVFLNYRRDGSPFFNLLLVAPLFDSQGKLRYYIGAQVDVTQLLRDGAGMESVSEPQAPEEEGEKDVFRELTELFNDVEIETARMYAGRLHKGRYLKREGATRRGRSRSRVVLKAGTPPHETTTFPDATSPIPQTLKGVYKNYLLLRPYPSLRILFTSPSLRTPGIHQMHFLHKIGGSDRVREELHDALRSGNGVTAKVLWLTNRDGDGRGRERWVHCTPLMDATGEVGVWMVIVVDPPTGQTRREVVETYRRPSVRKEGTPEDTHLRPGDTSSTQLPPTPTSPVPRIVRHELEVETDKGPQMFRLSDYIPPRGSSKKRPQKEKCDVDAFAKSLGMLAAN